jgi:hypothetical protein
MRQTAGHEGYDRLGPGRAGRWLGTAEIEETDLRRGPTTEHAGVTPCPRAGGFERSSEKR